MSEQHSQHVPIDPGRVHILDPLEVTYWCTELHCTEGQLSTAVAAVGEHVTEVRQHLPVAPAHTAQPPRKRHA